jgi:putative flippase GtrA
MAFPRFLIAGAINTCLTYILYLCLLSLMPYIWAYSLTYVVGIGLGYFLNAHWVFKNTPTLGNATIYKLTYVLNYFFSLVALRFLVELIHVPKEIAPLLVTAISVPVMFIITRAIFRGKSTNEKNNHQ